MANRRKEVEVPKHSHCMMCGAAIVQNETFCNDTCKEEYEKMSKRRRNMHALAFLPLIIAVIFIVVLLLLGSRR